MKADVKLGKLPHKADARTLRLARYLDPSALPVSPDSIDLTVGVASWPMFANDRLGDCTCAAMAHQVEVWTQQAAKATALLTDSDVVAAYMAVSGYDPMTGVNDNGAAELDVLNYWRKTGIGGHRIGAFAQVDHTNRALVVEAAYLTGGLYIGVALPATAQGQNEWKVEGHDGDSAPGSWGGHAVNVVGYDQHSVRVVTWGAVLSMTWDFWNVYVDEAWAVLSNDFLNAGESPEGFNLVQLQADLAKLGTVG